MPPEAKKDPNDALRELVAAMADVAKALQPNCTTVEELIGVLELATANNGMLSILADKLDPKARR